MKALFIGLISIGLFSSCAQAQKNKKSDAMKFNSVLDSVSYGLGVSIGENLKQNGLEGINTEMFSKAMQDVMAGKQTALTAQEADQIIRNYMMAEQSKKSEAASAEGKAFLEKNKAKKGVITLPSGLQYEVIKEGNGPKPALSDQVTTHYHGTLIDGTVFDSSVERGEPATFPVSGVIAGWTEALQLMPQGSKWRLFVPSNLAYGDRGAGGKIGPGATLIFEVELLSINNK